MGTPINWGVRLITVMPIRFTRQVYGEVSPPTTRVLKSFEATDSHGFRVRVSLTSRTLLLGKDEEYLTLCNVDVTMSFAEVEECWRTSRNARDLYVKAKDLYVGLGFTVEEVEG